MPNLAVLFCKGNEFIKKVSHYRRAMIHKIKGLENLGDRTIFADERRLASVFFSQDKVEDPLNAECVERKRIRKEEDEKHKYNTD